MQDVASLKKEGVAIPGWLRGTPTLVNVATRAVTEGTAALERLPGICGERPPEEPAAEPAAEEEPEAIEEEEEEVTLELEEEEEPEPKQQKAGSLDEVDELHDWDAEEEGKQVTDDAVKAMLRQRGMAAEGGGEAAADL